jgi:hypothetical protein
MFTNPLQAASTIRIYRRRDWFAGWCSMNSAVLRVRLTRSMNLVRDGAAVLGLFTCAIFLSALLLFSVQPVVAKMILPKLGGSPSVWAVSMCFFQAVLLAGYCYAHGLNRWAGSRLAPLIHLIVLALAVLVLPFFAISANAPLLQAWFARTGHPHASDPYFLYGASNLGSLVALLAYPTVIEPVLGLSHQARVWTEGFLVLGFLISASGLVMLAARSGQTDSGADLHGAQREPVAWTQRLTWIGLAFVPSGLLVAFTSYLSTDIASAPFLWVIPLAIFLATFVLVFRDRPVFPHHIVLATQPLLVTLVVLGLSISGKWGWMVASLAGFAAFIATTLACHKELYDRRPASTHLTEFYLWMSLGGVLGGIFAAILAPQVFNTVYEYPLLLLAGLLCRPGLMAAIRDRDETRRASLSALSWLAVLAVFGIAAASAGFWPERLAERGMGLFVIACGILMLLNGSRPLRQAVFAGLMALATLLLPSALNKGHTERSFFGVHRVTTSPTGEIRMLMHGTTMHGAQRVKDKDGRTVTDPVPVTYYHPESPMAQGVDAARTATGRTAGGLRVGIVGLGTGSLSCYARAGEAWRFYEIDPVVAKIARDPSLFSFLSRCQPDADIVIGDARLTLAKEPAAAFDYLVIDAFSSDAVPVHLLTSEAIALYLAKLTPSGIIALHVSNNHLDLVGVAVATAKSVPGTSVALVRHRPDQPGVDQASSHVVFVSRSAAAIAPLAQLKGGKMVDSADMAPWTDDYSDVLTALWRRYTGRKI